jgi:hypothetical protein
MPKQPMLSIEKVGDNRMFHSPARKQTAPITKVQFFTEKKMRDREEAHGRTIDVRPFNGEVRRGLLQPPTFGLVPLFH